MIVLVNHNNTTARYIFGMGNMCLKGCGWKEAIVWVEWGLKLDLFRSLPCTLFMNKWFHHYFCDRKKSMKVLQSAIFYKLLRIKNVIYDFCFLGSQKLPPSRPLPIQTHPPPPPRLLPLTQKHDSCTYPEVHVLMLWLYSFCR